MAGQIAELSHRTLQARLPQHRHQPGPHHPARRRPERARRVRRPPRGQGRRASSTQIGVEVQLGAKVVDVDATGIDVEDADGPHRRIESVCKVWAAGVQASELGAQLAEQSGAEVDRAGRVAVNDDLTLPGHPEVFVVGDMASLKGYPGVAQVAIQGARYAAEQIKRRLAGQEPQGAVRVPRQGLDGDDLAVQRGRLRSAGCASAGSVAWVLWLAVHLVYIIGFKHRLTTLLHWAVSFLGRGRSERTVTEQQVFARNAIEQLGEGYAPSLPRVACRPAAARRSRWPRRGTQALAHPLTAGQPGAGREPAGLA